MKKECACGSCQNACKNTPGWFRPGEAEKVAAFLGMPLDQLFKEKLGVNWWSGDLAFVLAPAVTSMQPGQEFRYDPRGTCVFFQDGKCSIHEVKPFECADTMCGDSRKVTEERHEAIADSWRGEEHQAQIVKLLGREPIEEEGSFYSLL